MTVKKKKKKQRSGFTDEEFEACLARLMEKDKDVLLTLARSYVEDGKVKKVE